MFRSLALLWLALICATPAEAGELFGGVFIHDIDSPLTKSGIEKGADVQLGYRWDRIGKTPLQPYIFGAVNTAGETHYAAVGVSARFFSHTGAAKRATGRSVGLSPRASKARWAAADSRRTLASCAL